jgi:hypothetical protein
MRTVIPQWRPESVYCALPKLTKSGPCNECAWAKVSKRPERRDVCRTCSETLRTSL